VRLLEPTTWLASLARRSKMSDEASGGLVVVASSEWSLLKAVSRWVLLVVEERLRWRLLMCVTSPRSAFCPRSLDGVCSRALPPLHLLPR
jgi:hypothetical protein